MPGRHRAGFASEAIPEIVIGGHGNSGLQARKKEGFELRLRALEVRGSGQLNCGDCGVKGFLGRAVGTCAYDGSEAEFLFRSEL